MATQTIPCKRCKRTGLTAGSYGYCVACEYRIQVTAPDAWADIVEDAAIDRFNRILAANVPRRQWFAIRRAVPALLNAIQKADEWEAKEARYYDPKNPAGTGRDPEKVKAKRRRKWNGQRARNREKYRAKSRAKHNRKRDEYLPRMRRQYLIRKVFPTGKCTLSVVVDRKRYFDLRLICQPYKVGPAFADWRLDLSDGKDVFLYGVPIDDDLRYAYTHPATPLPEKEVDDPYDLMADEIQRGKTDLSLLDGWYQPSRTREITGCRLIFRPIFRYTNDMATVTDLLRAFVDFHDGQMFVPPELRATMEQARAHLEGVKEYPIRLTMGFYRDTARFVGANSLGLRSGQVYNAVIRPATLIERAIHGRDVRYMMTSPVYCLYGSEEAIQRNWTSPA